MSPCTWPVSSACLPAITEDNAALVQAAVDTSVAVLWSFTGRQFGACPALVRPCPRERENWPWSWLPGYAWYPELDGGVWRNIGCGCGATCRVDGPGVVHLPGPVASIDSVTVDGAVIDSSLYVLEGDRLYATSGRWPEQDMGKPAGSPGTWSVEYLQGLEPPAGADQMVGILANEFYAACTGDKKCRLPKNVESLSRQGVSMKMADPAVLFGNMQTGLPEVDMWVAAVNPNRLSAPPVVSSPDYPARG